MNESFIDIVTQNERFRNNEIGEIPSGAFKAGQVKNVTVKIQKLECSAKVRC